MLTSRLIMEEDLSTPKPKRAKYYCDHCCDYLSKTTYYEHRRVYYDKKLKKWTKKKVYQVEEVESCSSSSLQTTKPSDSVYMGQQSSRHWQQLTSRGLGGKENLVVLLTQ